MLISFLKGQRIVFRVTGVPFMPGGLAAANTKLALTGDVGIRLNNAAKLIIKGSSGNTFVKWGCGGFSETKIETDVEFCRNYLTPL